MSAPTINQRPAPTPDHVVVTDEIDSQLRELSNHAELDFMGRVAIGEGVSATPEPRVSTSGVRSVADRLAEAAADAADARKPAVATNDK